MRYICLFMCMVGLVFSGDGLDLEESTIPVLDLNDYFDLEKKDQFIKDIQEACHKVGFFGLKNTGIDEDIIDTSYNSLKAFFSYDLAMKEQSVGRNNGFQRGYIPVGKEAAKGCPVGDFKEYYVVGRDHSQMQAELKKSWVNIWPDFMDLKGPVTALYDQLEKYSFLMQEIFSLALGEEKDFLNKICSDGDTACRMIHYPGCTKDSNYKRAVWAKAHTDIDMFTLLPRSTCKGLQVCDEKGDWIPVFAKEDAMIVNCGDFLEIFSNGYFKSSLHRVMQPKDTSVERYSSVHFVHPRSEALLYPLQRWIEKSGGCPKYIKATRWEMLMERLADLSLASDEMLKDLSETKVLERLMTVGRASKEAMQAVYDAGYATDVVKKEIEK